MKALQFLGFVLLVAVLQGCVSLRTPALPSTPSLPTAHATFLPITPALAATPLPTWTITPTPQDLGNGWFRFTEKYAGYSIDYPASARADNNYSAGFEFTAVEITIHTKETFPQNHWTVEIFAFSNPSALSIADFIQQPGPIPWLPAAGAGCLDYQPRRFHPAGIESQTMDIGSLRPAIVLSSRGKMYVLGMGVDMLSGNCPIPEARDTFYKIAQTFTLK